MENETEFLSEHPSERERETANDLLNQPSRWSIQFGITTIYKLIAVKTMRNNLKSDFPLDIKGVC